MKRWQKWGIGIFLVLAILVGGFILWGSIPAQPMPEAIQALQSDEQVTIENGQWLVFQPPDVKPQTGLIFYPGGRVDYRAYAPEAHAIAAKGFLVVIVPMPLNLAVFGIQRASEVIRAFPAVQHWVIGGHSLGGSMAASYAYQHPDAVQGLVFWASYPASNEGLSSFKLQVLSVFGSRDGLATPAKVDASRPLLPASTEWVEIKGGNHAQFGWYGAQNGDNPAEIDRRIQQEQVVSATVALLEKVQTQP